VVNTDDPWGRRLLAELPADVGRVTFGLGAGADVRGLALQLGPHGSAFRVASPWGTLQLRTPLLGRYNVVNVLGAFAAAGCLGVSSGAVAEALVGINGVPGRLEPVRTGLDFQVFVDYAHTDDALQHVLKTVREITRARLIVVFGCGGDRDRSKRPLMGRVASTLADLAIVTSDNPRGEEPAAIIEEIVAGIAPGAAVETREDRREAVRHAVAVAGSGDVIVIAGKGHEHFQEYAGKTIPFDDRQAVTEALEARVSQLCRVGA
jgi:UDP-N-acetylmuramoyl-L-alanyl-D-glutamate--2,6-diaminopimelate ligase